MIAQFLEQTSALFLHLLHVRGDRSTQITSLNILNCVEIFDKKWMLCQMFSCLLIMHVLALYLTRHQDEDPDLHLSLQHIWYAMSRLFLSLYIYFYVLLCLFLLLTFQRRNLFSKMKCNPSLQQWQLCTFLYICNTGLWAKITNNFRVLCSFCGTREIELCSKTALSFSLCSCRERN